jgi:5-oxoprolinase (ATP-hydrolysing)
MNRKVLLLSASFDRAKGTGAELAAAATRGALLDDPNAPSGAEQRPTAIPASGTARTRQLPTSRHACQPSTPRATAYCARLLPSDLAAVAVLNELSIFNVARSWTGSLALQVRRRLPEFAPAKVLDFGAGPSSALW